MCGNLFRSGNHLKVRESRPDRLDILLHTETSGKFLIARIGRLNFRPSQNRAYRLCRVRLKQLPPVSGIDRKLNIGNKGSNSMSAWNYGAGWALCIRLGLLLVAICAAVIPLMTTKYVIKFKVTYNIIGVAGNGTFEGYGYSPARLDNGTLYSNCSLTIDKADLASNPYQDADVPYQIQRRRPNLGNGIDSLENSAIRRNRTIHLGHSPSCLIGLLLLCRSAQHRQFDLHYLGHYLDILYAASGAQAVEIRK
ncbi:unnamed protein product [Sphagnum tenellum]